MSSCRVTVLLRPTWGAERPKSRVAHLPSPEAVLKAPRGVYVHENGEVLSADYALSWDPETFVWVIRRRWPEEGDIYTDWNAGCDELIRRQTLLEERALADDALHSFLRTCEWWSPERKPNRVPRLPHSVRE